ncbi:MAG TPA: membrane protein insertion efficiency factor YidD [Actinomycetota bacterium]
MTLVHRSLWTAGAPFRLLLVGLIRVYRATLSGWLGGQCRFYPSCSRYAEDAVRAHGALRGSAMAAWRIARCGPFTEGGVDHVPDPRHRRGATHGGYDRVIQQGTRT